MENKDKRVNKLIKTINKKQTEDKTKMDRRKWKCSQVLVSTHDSGLFTYNAKLETSGLISQIPYIFMLI